MERLLTRINGLMNGIFEGLGFYQPDRFRSDKLLRAFFLKSLFDHAKHLEGDIVECGVGHGVSQITWGALVKAEGKGRKVYGFDSFEGFPDPSEKDASSRNPKKGEYNDATMERITKMLRMANVPQPILVKGFFEDSLKNYEGKIALLYVDGDLYESTKTILETLFDKVVPGGVVGFDEYNDPKWPGATKAIDEFVKGRYSIQKGEYVNTRYYLIKDK